MQPFEPETTYLFCVETTYHDPQRFLVCLERFYPMARRGMSLLSPFSFDGRTTTVLVRVAPIKRYGPKQKLGVAQRGSFIISFALGIVIFVWITMTASGSHLCLTSWRHTSTPSFENWNWFIKPFILIDHHMLEY